MQLSIKKYLKNMLTVFKMLYIIVVS